MYHWSGDRSGTELSPGGPVLGGIRLWWEIWKYSEQSDASAVVSMKRTSLYFVAQSIFVRGVNEFDSICSDPPESSAFRF